MKRTYGGSAFVVTDHVVLVGAGGGESAFVFAVFDIDLAVV